MRTTAVIALPRFLAEAERVATAVDADLIEHGPDAFHDAFGRYSAIVALMSAGIAVRNIAPLLRDKWTDPAVVVVSPDLGFAIPVLGGHHGGNVLARRLADALGAVPVISTATEAFGRPSVEGVANQEGCAVLNRASTRAVNGAELDGEVPVYHIAGPAIVVAGPAVSILLREAELVVGVGCRRGIDAAEVIDAVEAALAALGMGIEQVFAYATTVKKRDETGLTDGVRRLGGDLVYLEDGAINAVGACGASWAGMIGLVGVAEPCALVLSRRKELVMKKTVFGRVTIAVAR